MPTVARLRRFELNVLFSLHALLHFRNVTAAGQHLGVIQPTMSGDLRRLRQMLGDALLVLSRGEYYLTALARSLVGPLAVVLAGIDQALTLRPNFEPQSDAHEFSVATFDHALPRLFQPRRKRSRATRRMCWCTCTRRILSAWSSSRAAIFDLVISANNDRAPPERAPR
jgi:DNA-binding transcriptional LysR family regulator